MHIFYYSRDPENHYDISEVTLETDTLSLPKLVEQFECYLRACGYVFDGVLDIVKEDK